MTSEVTLEMNHRCHRLRPCVVITTASASNCTSLRWFRSQPPADQNEAAPRAGLQAWPASWRVELLVRCRPRRSYLTILPPVTKRL